MEEEDSDVMGGSEGGGDCAAGENNTPMGSNNRDIPILSGVGFDTSLGTALSILPT